MVSLQNQVTEQIDKHILLHPYLPKPVYKLKLQTSVLHFKMYMTKATKK